MVVKSRYLLVEFFQVGIAETLNNCTCDFLVLLLGFVLIFAVTSRDIIRTAIRS